MEKDLNKAPVKARTEVRIDFSVKGNGIFRNILTSWCSKVSLSEVATILRLNANDYSISNSRGKRAKICTKYKESEIENLFPNDEEGNVIIN